MTRETKHLILTKFAEWLAISDETKKAQGLPLTQQAFAIHHGISEVTLSNWKNKLKNIKPTTDEQEAVLFLQQLAEDARKPSATSGIRELYARLKGLYVDRREVKQTVEFTPTDYARIATTVVERLREDYRRGGGNCPVCHKLPEVLVKICADSGQEHGASSEMATVAVSTRPPDVVPDISRDSNSQS